MKKKLFIAVGALCTITAMATVLPSNPIEDYCLKGGGVRQNAGTCRITVIGAESEVEGYEGVIVDVSFCDFDMDPTSPESVGCAGNAMGGIIRQ
ncbi:hypothetical protein [Roseivirga sp.]|uniref:hypothetical protein n=1 Tax=Roseivirga sp. TaxID=1964215 RepID=UPI003B8DB89D